MAAPSSSSASIQQPLALQRRAGGLLAVLFQAMASPCEVLLPLMDETSARELAAGAVREVWRIERKYSRYRDDSVVGCIHRQRGTRIELDPETAELIEFARRCYDLSAGMFDITSGVLRRAWRFDGSDRVPERGAVAALLPLIGFDKMHWDPPQLLLPVGMELDLGGIGKEYAVDRAFELLASQTQLPFLVNLGGDLRANHAPAHGAWQIGVEDPAIEGHTARLLQLERGALATSGDARRYLLKDGIRYGHILNPFTGWPVGDGPRSVTVAASSCTEAGMLATMAILQGSGARDFLQEQGVRHWLTD